MNKVYEVINNDYLISTDIKKISVQIVYDYLSTESYWAKDISFSTVQKSISNSMCFGLFYKNMQIGFARVVTDKATFAYLADVFIIAEHQNKGLGKWLIKTIHTHPDLQDLRRWMLVTKDAHNLYTQFGWSSITEEQYRRIMQKHNTDVYKKQ